MAQIGTIQRTENGVQLDFFPGERLAVEEVADLLGNVIDAMPEGGLPALYNALMSRTQIEQEGTPDDRTPQPVPESSPGQ